MKQSEASKLKLYPIIKQISVKQIKLYNQNPYDEPHHSNHVSEDRAQNPLELSEREPCSVPMQYPKRIA